MKTINHKGKIISMTDKDHAQMLRRFDPSKFKVPYHGSCAIRCNKLACPLCEKHAVRWPHTCGKCTLKQFETRQNRGCMNILKKDIFGSSPGEMHLMPMGSAVTYLKVDEDKAVKQLNLVADFLNQAK